MVAINGGTDYSYICYVAGTTMTWTYHTQFPVSSQFCVWRAFKQYQLCLVIKSIQHYVGWNNVKAVLISGRCLWQGISMKTVHTINHNTITEYKTKPLVHFLSAKYTINILGAVVWTVFVHNKSHLSRARCRVVRILASHSPGLIPPPVTASFSLCLFVNFIFYSHHHPHLHSGYMGDRLPVLGRSWHTPAMWHKLFVWNRLLYHLLITIIICNSQVLYLLRIEF